MHWVKEGLVARPAEKKYTEKELSDLQQLIDINYTKGSMFYEFTVPEDAAKAVHNQATRLPAVQGLT